MKDIPLSKPYQPAPAPGRPSRAPKATRRYPWPLMMLLVTVFQALSFAPVWLRQPEPEPLLLLSFVLFPAAEWLFLFLLRFAGKQRRLELEVLGLWLSGIGLTVCGSLSAEYAWKQGAAILMGMAVYGVLLWVIASPDRAMKLRPLVAVGAVGLLLLNLLLARVINGARNWIDIGPFSIQPSELVKLAFLFVGAATLDRLQSTQSITRYLIFSLGCVGALFLMQDFGTALIFFATFLIIVFLRSGDLRAIALVCAAAVMGAGLIIFFKPYVYRRFMVYRHVWEQITEGGYQQTRVLIYSASGGWFGLGIGNGRLRQVFAASTDLVFGILAEEWGRVLAFLVPVCYICMAVYALRAARHARSSFYTILTISAAGMLLFQAGLNIFGITDLLPLTGVTLPFISRGGTSMLCAWGLLAFLRAGSMDRRAERLKAGEKYEIGGL